MDTPAETTISLSKALFEQADVLAHQLGIAREELVARAIAQFIAAQQPHPIPTEARTINQGDIFWVQVEKMGELDTGIAHPYVVIQDNLFNHSRIHTVVICALTSNLRRVSDTPGNVLLDVGEANLPKQSVVEVSKVSTVEKTRLGEYIGALSAARVNEILAGMRFLQLSYLRR